MLSSEKADGNSRKMRRNSYIKSESSDTRRTTFPCYVQSRLRKWIALLLHFVIEHEIASYFAYGNPREQIRVLYVRGEARKTIRYGVFD